MRAKEASSIGSPGAAESWLNQHGDALYAFALRQVHSAETAEDLVQETLLAAIEARKQFEGRSSERTWLVAILKHKIVDHLRRLRRRTSDSDAGRLMNDDELEKWAAQQFTSTGKWVKGPSKWASGVIDPSQLDELRKVLLDCLARLPDRAAEALLHVECRESSIENVCKHFRVSATNLGVILHRARLAMRHCLQAHWFGAKLRDK